MITYHQTIQRAFGDVSDALIGYDKYHAVRERQEQTVKDLQESVDVSLMRYNLKISADGSENAEARAFANIRTRAPAKFESEIKT